MFHKSLSLPRHLKFSYRVLIVTTIIAVVIGCGSERSTHTEIALNWWQAFVNIDRNKLAELTCEARQADLELSMNILAVWTKLLPKALGNFIGIGALDVELSSYQLSAYLVNENDNNAVIGIQGKLRPEVGGISGTQGFDYQLNEGCANSLPEVDGKSDGLRNEVTPNTGIAKAVKADPIRRLYRLD